MSKIAEIVGRKIMDSREKPTVEVKITTEDGFMGIDSVPSGTSTGSREDKLVEPDIAINNINNIIAPQLIGKDVHNQQEIDRVMIDMDGTENKSKLGANAILGISLAVARTAALRAKMPLFWYINKFYTKISGQKVAPAIPTPMMVMICGGRHGKNNLCIQEFSLLGKMDQGIKVWQNIEKIIKDRKIEYTIGLEGAFSPNLQYDEDALDIIFEACNTAGYKNGSDVRIGVDIAGNNCRMQNSEILNLVRKYDLYSIEDPFGETDWEKFGQFKLELEEDNRQFILLGDDLFATHKNLLQKGINNLVANAIIIKVNQVGTLTETLEVIALAQKANYTHVVSHRSGETTDTFIADLAVGTAAKFLKSGAPFPRERVLKYKRLNEIEEEL
ncbi:MAG: Enolase [Berkelbacteria bacterium GW2011_GWA1_39_10]|uniref:Enolase n=1 Tax=Berkelbacteria bacterium GW2011_GWA1_39_10 TaxID=1618332 RepID=A0A0G0LS81_9BACT|nr:MAG: Enolase [Berkelbacteria bacterium GW2011_GWA1_39_10]